MRSMLMRCATLVALGAFISSHAQGQTAAPAQTLPLQLEAIINQKPTGMIIPVMMLQDGSLAVMRGELSAIGIEAPGKGLDTQLIPLTEAGLPYIYDEARQRLYFDVTDTQRSIRIIDARGITQTNPPPTSGWGALLNYTTFASTSTTLGDWQLTPAVANLSADLRMFSPYGLINQTGIIGTTPAYDLWKGTNTSALRLETNYVYADPDTQRMYRAGDIINGSLEWTRSIRMGGLQVQRNFGIRPDIVTAALPSASGSAVVPSSVDVLVNGVRVLTQQVPEGPFRLTNLPIASGNGDVQMVIRDASGRETRSELTLLSGERMLAPGIFDYTLEAGMARKFYALRSNDYDNRPLLSASARYGLHERVTLQSHVETGSGGFNLGAGTIFNVGQLGTINAALSGSSFATGRGAQAYISYALMTSIGVSLSASTQRTFRNYDDLASATAIRWANEAKRTDSFDNPFSSSSTYLFYTHPPKEIHRLSLGSRIPGLGGHASLSFAQITTDPRDQLYASSLPIRNLSRTVSTTYSRPVMFGGNLFITGFGNLSGRKERGLFAGLSFPLGERMQIGGGLQTVSDGQSGSANMGGNIFANKAIGPEIGSYGWSASATGGATSMVSGSASYRTPVGTARVTALQQGNAVNATSLFEGALAFVDGHFAMGPRVDDAFAVIRTDASGVIVRQENNPIGSTTLLGTMLVPSLRSYQRNKIDIDPTTLPSDVSASRTQENIAPTYRSGVALDFRGAQEGIPTLLVVTDGYGRPIDPGSKGLIRDTNTPFVVGFDGKAYIALVQSHHDIEIDLGDRICAGNVQRPSTIGSHQEIPVTCQ